ncbi:MAG: hypothetical protein U9N84_09720 [Actinomycetota bacterium]|nr:hypothetical protein [Actinomycetota bacterium]
MVNRARSLWQTATAFTKKPPADVLTQNGPVEGLRINAASVRREHTTYASTAGAGACLLQLNHRPNLAYRQPPDESWSGDS